MSPLSNLLELVRQASEEKKGEEYLEIEVSKRTILADHFVLVTGRSKIQSRAICDTIEELVKASGQPVARTEGYAEGTWILLDLGSVIVHIFTPEQRRFYNLERLWVETPKKLEGTA